MYLQVIEVGPWCGQAFQECSTMDLWTGPEMRPPGAIMARHVDGQVPSEEGNASRPLGGLYRKLSRSLCVASKLCKQTVIMGSHSTSREDG